MITIIIRPLSYGRKFVGVMDRRAEHNIRLAAHPDLGDDYPGLDSLYEEVGGGGTPFIFTPEHLEAARLEHESFTKAMTMLANQQAEVKKALATETKEKVEKVVRIVADAHFQAQTAHAQRKYIFTGDVEKTSRTIKMAGSQAGDIKTPRAKFEWKELNAILGLVAHVNDVREQRMLECEKQELHYANKVGSKKPDEIGTKTYTVTNTAVAARQHNMDGSRTITTRENKQGMRNQ